MRERDHVAKGRRYRPAAKPQGDRACNAGRLEYGTGRYVVLVDEESRYVGELIPQVIMQEPSLRVAVRAVIDLHRLGRKRARIEVWNRKREVLFEVDSCVEAKPKARR